MNIWWYILTIVHSLSFGSVTLTDRTTPREGIGGEREEIKYYCFRAFYLLPYYGILAQNKGKKGGAGFISAKTKSTFYASVTCCYTWFSRVCYPGHKSNNQWLRTELCPMWIQRKLRDSVGWVKQAPVIIAVGFFLAKLAGILDQSASHWSFLFIGYWIIRALPLRNKQHLMLKCSHKFPSWEFLNYARREYSSGQSVQMDALKCSWLRQ